MRIRDVDPISSSKFGIRRIPGYGKSAYDTVGFGTELGIDMETYRYFYLISHLKWPDVLVELAECGEHLEYIPIDKEYLKGFVKGTTYEDCLVEMDGRVFFRGFDKDMIVWGNVKKMRRDVIVATQAARFLDDYGDYLAVGLNWQGNIHTAADGMEVSRLLDFVNEFKLEMEKSCGSETHHISRIQERLKDERKFVSECDKRIIELHTEHNKLLDELRKLGLNSLVKHYSIDEA